MKEGDYMPGGRPNKFETPEELEKLIQHYFDSITKTEYAWNVKTEGKGKSKKIIIEPILNNAGEQVTYTSYYEIPTVTGMCLHIGISRSTLFEYEKKEEFTNTIKSAKDRIEKYNEEQLYRREQVTGVIFNLKNNFGWRDKQEQEVTATNNNYNYDMSKLSTEQLEHICKLTDAGEIEQYYNDCVGK